MTVPAPRLSVLMPVYNGLPRLWEAAESVLRQTYSEFEFLVVDDGSTDGSSAACDDLAARDGRVRVLRHPKGENRGIVASLALGLASARGELVARMDADDRAYPERFARQVAYLDAHPEVALVGSAVHVRGRDGSVVTRVPATSPALIRWKLRFGVTFTHPTVTMRRRAVEAAGGYTAAAPHNEDHDLWLRMARQHDLANLPVPLLFFDTEGTTNVSTVHAGLQRETTIRLVQRAMSELVGEVERGVATDLHDSAYGRPLSDRPDARLEDRIEAAVRLLSDLSDAACRRRPADAPAIRADAALKMDALAWKLRASGWGRGAAVWACARWAPRLCALSTTRRIVTRFASAQPVDTP